MSGSEDKKELRALYARAREALSPADRAEFSRRAMARLAALPEFREAGTVLVYRSLPGELDPSSLLLLPAAAAGCLSVVSILRAQDAKPAPGTIASMRRRRYHA